MPYTQPQDKSPGVTDVGKIVRHFFEHSDIDKSKGYELLSEVSDEELGLFYGLIERSDIADHPTEEVYMVELQSKRSARKLLLKAARYDDQNHPMIAMAVFDITNPGSMTQEEAIESFSLFANETGEGFTPVNFSTYTKH